MVSVYWRGRNLGRAPATFDLPSGAQSLRLRDSALGIDRGLSLVVVAGQSVSRHVSIGRARLSLRVSPWAEVTLDGRAVGTTPLAPIDTYEGRHVLELDNPQLSVRRRVVVELREGETRTVREILDPSP